MILAKQVEQIYKKALCVRHDNADGFFYFSPEDFPGLKADPYTFASSQGHELCGFFYRYEDPIPGRILVFDHGMGNGHRAYMREIEVLCKAGFLVFSYDHTGCMASGGEDITGFSQSLRDLDDCIRALKAEPALQGRSFSVIGHSWGGFSAMNISALHPDITHVVAMCGFISVKQILAQTLKGISRIFRNGFLEAERSVNPKYADCSAVETLKTTAAKVLLVYSSDDKTVQGKFHYAPLRKALSGRDNIRFLLVEKRDHNPTYTQSAVAYKGAFFRELAQKKQANLLKTPEQKQAFMAQFDWQKMTQQDEDVWNQIIAGLKDE